MKNIFKPVNIGSSKIDHLYKNLIDVSKVDIKYETTSDHYHKSPTRSIKLLTQVKLFTKINVKFEFNEECI